MLYNLKEKIPRDKTPLFKRAHKIGVEYKKYNFVSCWDAAAGAIDDCKIKDNLTSVQGFLTGFKS